MNRLVRLSMLACGMALLAAAAAGSECLPQTSATASALAPQWRAAAYGGMVGRLNPTPRIVENVKFLFLGDPVLATVQGRKGRPDMHGYGGLVAIRWKSILWRVEEYVHFYLVDADGNVLSFYNINHGEADDTSPTFYDVRVNRGSTYEKNPSYWPVMYDNNGAPIPGSGSRHEDEYIWVNNEETVIEPVLDARQKEMLRVFRRTSIGKLPVYQ